MESLPLLILIVIALVFFVVMPQRQRKAAAAKQQALREKMSPGTRVMTTSGLYGAVVRVTDESVELEIAPGVVTSWLPAAVREVVATETSTDLSAQPATEPSTGGATGSTATGGIVQGDGDPTDPTR